ncbi:Ubiquinone/menaquinone biosynthesis C-methyltransferase UbiE [Aquicella siphonis]|uniref:Ubiquinone/menaquinone biosynthesis C-methyltransferase UbiE n=1 Tax=Aquicella siphonis TaxID=254247 RepID=A0A5E4PK38_9COXI|nr:bifunctional demethylmenaquinone methyltransferase/2-methoxy-6-polyprenyl-1,4-benzoquinol methylase UbiE [Aquicella siphonis]VVC76868.1 Ubiquinone/menaquinone biosynthesis C-methyltransferase UbiE [Aquicella siphonis]
MPSDFERKTTHFGYREVPKNEKAALVAEVFRSVAPKYDLMNDLMSLGMHRLWKRFAIEQAALRPGDQVLDVASGTGDLAKALARVVGSKGRVVMTDINEAMLQVGRERLEDAGVMGNIDFIQADAENLPFVDHYFDCVTIAFGLRNVTDKVTAMKSMHRVLKPGGKLLILEFSHPQTPLLNKLYDLYSFNIIPRLGALVTNDRDSYQYLVESIRMHPNQDALKAMMHEAGFEDVEYYNLCDGIVAVHKGYKY